MQTQLELLTRFGAVLVRINSNLCKLGN